MNEALARGPVGCIFVRDRVIIAKVRNRTNELRNVTRHAELEIIAQFSLRCQSCPTLYVMVEPRADNDKFGEYGKSWGTNNIYHPVHSVYKAAGAYQREETNMTLRRFYIMENKNAFVPKLKVNRVLKTEILLTNAG
ncbi:hypothetical protein EV421DRAFT_1888298 [Armillaria borealis]|uniref:CMP/dCMP-type deaminase domain-containing protein n=1 Tax=Armillaria borealis TaxID=47425 RepID=A0AA39K164_9AGAR|nr:hypothetical protein EV421DRAFT_1888298 [Armillaria borealis]